MTQQIYLKRGTTFAVDVAYEAAPAEPLTITSQVRHKGTLIADLTVLPLSSGLGFQVFAPLGTSAWPLATLQCDLKFTQSNGSVFFSETFEVVVTAGVTA